MTTAAAEALMVHQATDRVHQTMAHHQTWVTATALVHQTMVLLQTMVQATALPVTDQAHQTMARAAALTMVPPAHQTITEAWALLQAHATAAITTAAAATAGTVPATE